MLLNYYYFCAENEIVRKMKNKYLKLVTCIALVAILALQGIWLYNTYTLLEREMQKNISNVFIRSIEKDISQRLNNPVRKGKWKNWRIEGVSMENDIYANSIALQNFLYLEEYPLSLQKLDTILHSSLEGLNLKNYTLTLIDSLGNTITSIYHVKKKVSEQSGYKEKIQLRSIDPEYIEIVVFSPYKFVFEKMLLLLIGSACLSVFIIYCLFLQIRMIARQDRIAKIRQDFTHAMIHDLKNPLTSILSGVHALKSGKIDNKLEMKMSYYNIITKESKHILSIINKILTIAQFEEKQIILSKQRIDLTELFNNVTEKYSLEAQKEVKFQIELNGIQTIYADKEYIIESFNNLIDNAVKYSKNTVNIRITCFEKGRYVQIKFRDDGFGISSSDQKIVFEKFERGSSVKKEQKTSGFGLGLSFVYQIITAHEGMIDIDSTPNEYSEFTINLPKNAQTNNS
jgi:two-component system phosphate regulon sensor histidine kinase PhoR